MLVEIETPKSLRFLAVLVFTGELRSPVRSCFQDLPNSRLLLGALLI